MTYTDKLAIARQRNGHPFAVEVRAERRAPRSPLLQRLDRISGVNYTAHELERQARALKAEYIDSLAVGAASLRAVRADGGLVP